MSSVNSIPTATSTVYISVLPATATPSGGSGGNVLHEDLNKFYDYGNTSWILACTPLCLIMVPGVAFFYSGLARRKNTLALIMLSMLGLCVSFFQWYFWGYSLAFSQTGTSGYIGNLRHFAFIRTLADYSPGSNNIPELVFANFQGMFAAITVALFTGAAAERGRIGPMLIITFVWLTVVYCPIACWIWNPNGWAFKFGVYDFAGGGPVEVGSGFAALAYTVCLGRRSKFVEEQFRPHSVLNVVLGTSLLWFGWLGFNGGSAYGSNLRAAMAITNTNLAGAVAGLVWVIYDYIFRTRKWSTIGFCSGVVAGLVAATPCAGFVSPHASLAIGAITGLCCNWAIKLKSHMRIDDAMDIFAIHGVAGFVGTFLNGLFAVDYIAAMDGIYVGENKIRGGWFDHHWRQLGLQMAYICAVGAYDFVVTFIILFITDKIPYLQLRVSPDAEEIGVDADQIGEYAFDYIEERREYKHWKISPAGVPEEIIISNGVAQPTGNVAAPGKILESTNPLELGLTI
ncbi:plasma membrane ammonium transmembrane transporter Amt2 [Schizosaccharomyces pombe]|uniref:Ammonium transporter 2 n=1 Tax=Schizosaccharomyces pombe (strain 972 / ATCC 24843) TaxID=284812 RepID=AMT2_SCHPO|nr:ammonium transporter Amt2 [Schizosaccharomyces pombe]Q9US00.1 RecName: Full=Ammonium transporter 2 [Schizosaccharomyces pombe 972h-]CAB65815.1 ammonium transporter Amt2 [Schizosaccharomyces pombe]|eukprot:NP_593462.1 ammonium transporter Amt2 [Schizosaccharomyces pombe]